MILDNVDDIGLLSSLNQSSLDPDSTSVNTWTLLDYLPRVFSSQKSLFVTTRSSDVNRRFGDGEQCVLVSEFSPREARTLLRLKLKGEQVQFDHPITGELLNTLAYVPLAITQAASFINRNLMKIPAYLKELRNDDKNLLDFLSEELQDPRREPGYPNSVFRTLKISFDQLLTQEPPTAHLLSFVAVLSPQQIPRFLLRQSVVKDLDLERAIGTLHGLSLVQPQFANNSVSYSVHKLVHSSLQYWLKCRDQRAYYNMRALQALDAIFPYSKYENTEICESLYPHARVVLNSDAYLRDIDKPSRAALLHKCAKYDHRQGRYESAYSSACEAYELRKAQFGEKAPSTLVSMHVLASVLRCQSRYQEAGNLYRLAHEGYKGIYGAEDLQTLVIRSNLAGFLLYSGKCEEAEDIHRDVLRCRTGKLGSHHPDTVSSMGRLARALLSQDKTEEAEPIARQVLKLKEKILGVRHPKTLSAMDDLADILLAQGELGWAEELCRRALEGREEILGSSHPLTLSSLCQLARSLNRQRKYQAAESACLQALKDSERTLGACHFDTLRCMGTLADIYYAQKRLRDALPFLSGAYEGMLKSLGPEHPFTRGCHERIQVIEKNSL